MMNMTVSRFGSSDGPYGTHLFGMTNDPLHSKAFHRLFKHFRMDRIEGRHGKH